MNEQGTIVERFLILKSEIGKINNKDVIYDGICEKNCCEFENVAEFDDKETAISEFNRHYSSSEYWENYQSLSEYELVKETDIIDSDGDIIDDNYEIILRSHYEN